MPGLSNLKLRFSPVGQVPRLWPSFLLPLIAGQKMLCATLSLFRNFHGGTDGRHDDVRLESE